MLSVLNESQSLRLDEAIDAFEEACEREGHADLSRFVPEPGHPAYLAVLGELIRVDLERSWNQGQGKRLEEYRVAFPELFQDQKSLRAIAFEEYRVRRQAGESPRPEEYGSRFGIDTFDWPSDPVRLDAAAVPGQRSSSNGRQKLIRRQDSVDGTALSPAAVHNQVSAESYSDPCKALPRDLDPLAADSPEVGTQWAGFRLVCELGRGAFGRVYLARQGELAARHVVLKVSTDIWSESQALSQLQHTNIVPIYSITREGPLQAVCMPYFGSTTLADLLRELISRTAMPYSAKGLLSTLADRRHQTAGTFQVTRADGHNTSDLDSPARQTLPPPAMPDGARTSAILEKLEGLSYVEAVVWIVARLADGLAHAHERGILHRDLKPANILLTEEGQPMLLDFNLSTDNKLRPSAAAALVGGTLPYMAPEHIDALQDGSQPVDVRSDLFSLGVILFELLSGRQPFPIHQGTLETVLPKMIADRWAERPQIRRWNPTVPRAVESIVRRCLEAEPSRRYQSARQLQEDLQRQLDNLPLKHAPEPSIRERARKWLRRHPRLSSSTAVGAVAAVLVFLLASLFVLRGRHVATLEALDNFSRFRAELKPIQFLLNVPEPETRPLDEGITLCRGALGRYQVLENSAWAQAPAVRHLEPEEQRRLCDDIGELLLLLARATAHDEASADERGGDKAIPAALRLNSLAQACYSPDEIPRATWTQRADLLKLAGQDEQSRHLEQMADGVPLRTARDHYLSGAEFVSQWRFQDALPLLQEANRQDPQNFAVWLVLGNTHAGLSQFSDAAGCFRACSALWPDAHWPHYNRGLAHLDEKDYVRACAAFDKAIELRPDHAESFINRGLSRLAMENHAGAIEDFTQALQLGAPYTRVYFMRARAREKAGDREGAKQDREEGLRREPADEQSWIARGVARLAGDPQGALADFERALALNSRSRAALENKAHVLSERLGRADEAIAVLDRVVALHPGYVLARAGRGVLLARAGKRDVALRDAEEALACDSRPTTQYQVAGIYALTSHENPEDRPQALRLLASALRQDPRWLKVVPKDSDLDAIRDLPDFRQLIQAMSTVEAIGKNQ